MKKADLFFNVARLPVDFVMLLLAGAVTYVFRTEILSALRPVLFEFNLPFSRWMAYVFALSFLFVLAFAISGLYAMRGRMRRGAEFLRIVVASSGGVMAVIIYIFLRQELFNSRFLVLGAWFFAIIFVFIGRLIVGRVQRFVVGRYGFGVHKLMVVGDDEAAARIVEEIRSDLASGYRVVKWLLDPDVSEVTQSISNPGVDDVILTKADYPPRDIAALVEFCHDHHIAFRFIPNIHQTLTTNFEVDIFSGMPLIELKRTALDGWGRVAKRALDIVLGGLALVVLSPIFLVVTVVIKWETAGPVFVRLRRISRNRTFNLLKFRSMLENAEELKAALSTMNERGDSPLFKMKDDPRITRAGKFLRRYRIDEFPQFWNVFVGDISLAGPRPHQPDEIARYEKHHKKVLAIKAGATGLAQVSGSSDLPFEQEVALDTFYVENWSMWMDIKIIARTAVRLLLDRSAV